MIHLATLCTLKIICNKDDAKFVNRVFILFFSLLFSFSFVFTSLKLVYNKIGV